MPEEGKAPKQQRRRGCGAMTIIILRQASICAILLVLLCALGARAETCEEKGLVGQCNGCVCCCSKGSAFVRAVPKGCDCSRTIDRDDALFASAVAAVLLLPTVVASCWFGAGGCCGSGSPFVPTPARQQRMRAEQMGRLQGRTALLPTAAVVSPPRPSAPR